MFYKTPIYGYGFKPQSTSMIEVTPESIGQWKFKKLLYWNKQEFVLFSNGKDELMQSMKSIRFVRCKPGEENYNAKLTNAQGIEIFQRASNGESAEAIASEFGISKRYVQDIKNLKARTSVTLDFINGVTKKAKAAQAIVAKRNKGKKLSLGLAKFIRNDSKVQKLSVKALAKKYCVSERTIQRILKFEMYK